VRIAERYVLRERLERTTWLAYDERLRRAVVLKQAAAGEPRAMARLNHPHVITVYEHADGWAVLEYAPGGSLAGRQLPPVEAARIGAQVADALVYMHGKGIVHCDVKPGNIVLAEDGTAKLTDFGSAYHVDPEATITPQAPLSYTPAYAAPELVRGNPVPASDVYSLAVTVRTLAPALNNVLADLLSTDWHDRPDAGEARRILRAIAAGEQPGVDAGPAQLPADVYGFAGRTAELDRLDRVSAPIVVISGTAGVGKTTLAVHWAHRVAGPTRRSRTIGHFPDGQLYVNLRGFDPTGQVVEPADALRGFLDALGLPPEQIPATLDAQAALYRSVLSGKRVLVVLDNARDSEQVRPLLPGNPDCLAIVISRNDLIGLVTKGAAHPVTLDVLSEAEARQLLDHRIGPDRTAAEEQAVVDIIQSCARLPLALAVVAARAALRPDFSLASLANRLDALTGDDPDSDVRTVFSWSYEQLSQDAQRLFRLLGLHPGPDISAPAAASLAGTTQPPLAELTSAHLVAEPVPGRYTFHDLLRAYATELAHATDAQDDRDTATHRMLDHYLHTAHSAAGLLRERDLPMRVPPPRAGVRVEALADHDDALAWFTAERSVLLSVVEQAASSRVEIYYISELARMLDDYLNRQGHWHDLVGIWRNGLAAAQSLGDEAVRARAHRELGRAFLRLSRFDEALTHSRQALDLHAELGDRVSLAHVHRNLGAIFSQQGRHLEALEHDKHVLDLLDPDDLARQAMARNNLGYTYAMLGDNRRALTWCQSAFELNQRAGRRSGEASSSDSLGLAYYQLGQHDQAIARYQHALDLFTELGDRYNQADTLSRLGDAQRANGDQAAARTSWEHALAILEELGHADAEAVRARLEGLERGAPVRP
jgi:tetratricopeptide (TPR) repeat protein